MRRLSIGLVMVGLLVLAAPALAQQAIVIELEGWVEGPTDSVMLVHQETVDPSLIGGTCTGTAQTENNSSVHPGNDLILTTGGASAEFTDIEDVPGQIDVLSGSLVLGETIDVSLRFGEHAQSSLGVVITLDCAPLATTTTTTTTAAPETTTTTAAPETTTTTTTQAPVGGVDTGAGGTSTSGQAGLFVVALASAAVAGVGGVTMWKRRSEF